MNLYSLGILVALLILSVFSPVGKSEKILFLTPVAFKSHKNVFEPLIRELGSRGHEVTVISPIKSANMPKTVKEINPVKLEDITGPMESAFTSRKKGRLNFMTSWNSTVVELACDRTYENPQVKELLATQKYDLVFLNGLLNHCAYGMVYLLKAPFIVITTMPAPQDTVSKAGHYFPPSFIPSPFSPFTDRMSFTEKLGNIGLQLLIKVAGVVKYSPMFEEIYKKHLGQDVPDISIIDKNVSMIFMNSHFSMTYPRPLLPDIIEVGGMHCRPAQPLPQDLDNFLSGAKDGFIYFSLGTIIKPADMPEKTRKAFLNVFSKLKQRVIWKWDIEMPDLPSNVKILPFLPQQDILGHPNIKIFMTHGGLLSTQEAIYHGVPLLGIPLFGDQDLNMMQAERYGFCLQLEILDFTEEDLQERINRLLYEPSFKQRAGSLSSIFRDQPETPLQRAVYWTEYVIRHKGAIHLRSAARELNFFQYQSLDVISLLIVSLLVLVCIVQYVIRLISRRLCSYFGKCGNAPDKVSKKKKVN